jgi:hypothetical protein
MAQVDAQVSYNALNLTVTIVPAANLAANSFYQVALASSIATTSGKTLAIQYGQAGFKWTFHTKNDPTACRVNRVEVSPANKMLSYVG